MSPRKIVPTGREVFFDNDDIIVSKTDLKGRITYANKTFCHIAGYTEREVLGQPHSLIRHPDMPRAVFKLLWDTLQDGRELFAYVKNMARNGDHYWVFAHVTPSYDTAGKLAGYHSNRRVPDRKIVESTIVPLYAQLLSEEQRHKNGKEALAAGHSVLESFVRARNMGYDQLVFSL
jgi:PAS domain S-box-containing protein